MKNNRIKKLVSGVLALSLAVGAFFAPGKNEQIIAGSNKSAVTATATRTQTVTVPAEMGQAKYVFLFIGDGMSHIQVNLAQAFRGTDIKGEIKNSLMNFSEFSVSGVATTHDSTSFCPDSASTATSIAGGVKTHSGVIGLTADLKEEVKTVAQYAKEAGKKVGIISTVTLNHATPAAFYASVESRNSYYEIGEQMAASDFDFFGGGSLKQRTGKEEDKKDLYDLLKEAGYTVTETKEDLEKLKPGQKAYSVTNALQDDGAMTYAIDQNDKDIRLKDLVKKGIELLDNENGFFMMAESGKIDWACHANDAATVVREVLELEAAIQEAVDFYKKHPNETLILVTGDHETGGLTIGYATTGYKTALDMMLKQKSSYIAFDEEFKEAKEANPSMTFTDIIPMVEEKFGLKIDENVKEGDEIKDKFQLTAYELQKLKAAFEESMKDKESRTATQETGVLYGGYEPLSVTLTHLLNNKAGIGWTSYAHTGTPVAVYAEGACAEAFTGYYENTDIFFRMMDAMGLKAE